MDWQNTNGVLDISWESRSTPASNSYSYVGLSCGCSSGVPIEEMVLISNILGTNPWFNMVYIYMYMWMSILNIYLKSVCI
jgi:hypothetical protein